MRKNTLLSLFLMGLCVVFNGGFDLALAAPKPHALSFTVNSVTANPTSVSPGQTVNFSTTVTANQNASDYTIGLQIYFGKKYLQNGSKLFTGLNFQANKPFTKTSKWTIPTGTTAGTYTILAGVFDSSWNWITGKSATFTIAKGVTPPPAACGSTPSGSTVTQTVSTTPGTIAATTTQCPYGGTEPTVTTVTQTYLCTNGTLSAQGSPVSTTTDNGNPTCNPAPVNGACGTANGVESTSAPSTNLCSSGSASAVTESGTTLWDWTCSGSNGGSNASCSAPLQPAAVNGSCGSANGTGVASAPSSNLCSSGVATSISGSGPWTWVCDGTSGGSNSGTCTAPVLVNGTCGSANGLTATSAPTSNLCGTGTATSVSGSGPWSWNCNGSNGGSNTSCLAPVSSSSSTVQVPGPSAALFANPYYACVNNYYVSTTGSDSNPGTLAKPWLTLQHANNSLPTGGSAAGSCINVEPGTYSSGVLITAGGNKASSNGYVVYRCASMDACIVTDVAASGQNGSFVWGGYDAPQPMTGNYVIIDGFTMSAASETLYGQGIELTNGTNSWVPSVHHVWILNSIISGYGQSGISMNNGEYFYVVHNKIYNNANVACSAQGSGISYFLLMALSGYTPTADDLSNPMLGNIGPSFHNAVEWNVLYNNALTSCGTVSSPWDTDGNNIIMDTLNWDFSSGTVPYTDGVLIAFNVTYNAGGGGVHMTNSEDVTVANNTCYNNYLDPADNATWRGCIDTDNSYSDTVINNLAVAVPAAHPSNCWPEASPYAMFNSSIIGGPPSTSYPPNTYSNNITYVTGGPSCGGEDGVWNGDTYSSSANKENTDPGWVNAGTTSTGTETTPPVGVNFSLAPGSPAIGYGLTESYLPPQSVDAGACSSKLSSCP